MKENTQFAADILGHVSSYFHLSALGYGTNAEYLLKSLKRTVAMHEDSKCAKLNEFEWNKLGKIGAVGDKFHSELGGLDKTRSERLLYNIIAKYPHQWINLLHECNEACKGQDIDQFILLNQIEKIVNEPSQQIEPYPNLTDPFRYYFLEAKEILSKLRPSNYVE